MNGCGLAPLCRVVRRAQDGLPIGAAQSANFGDAGSLSEGGAGMHLDAGELDESYLEKKITCLHMEPNCAAHGQTTCDLHQVSSAAAVEMLLMLTRSLWSLSL
eukprot:scaffold570_cov382-Prasinococcus_capsulatus_cf.AAC.3